MLRFPGMLTLTNQKKAPARKQGQAMSELIFLLVKYHPAVDQQ